MTIAQSVQDTINTMPPGKLFGYRAFSAYGEAPEAVIKAVGRMVSDNRLKRLSKGRFYVPETGVFGQRKPSDDELIRSVLYKNGRLRGYVTGVALFNRLGLTTQLPKTIVVAVNGGVQQKDFGTIRIKMVVARAPVQESDVRLLQYLDVLREIKKIPDADINQSLKIMARYLSELSKEDRRRAKQLALDYYTPQTRALAGMIFSGMGGAVDDLKQSLNPTTVFRLKLDKNLWPLAKDWNIQ